MPTLSFEDVDVYHQVDVIHKHCYRLVMDKTWAQDFQCCGYAIFFKLNCDNTEAIEKNNITYILF